MTWMHALAFRERTDRKSLLPLMDNRSAAQLLEACR